MSDPGAAPPPPSPDRASQPYDPPAPSGEDPARTLGLIALLLAIFLNIVGAIVGIVALNKSRRAGHKNGFAVAAIIVGFTLFVISLIIGIVIAVSFAQVASEIATACQGMSGQEITFRGVPFVCP